jgi:uncharacterized RDD family membrane protein YckC
MTAGIRELTGLRGHYAGFASRFLAFVIDLAVISALFGLALAAISFATSLIRGHTFSYNGSGVPVAIAYGCWWFVYFAYSWAVSGKTFGMAVLGVQVVSREGAAAGARRAIVRTLVFPLSFLLLGLGFVGILIDGERRALHDIIAGTAVVYSWDARAQRLRFLARDDLTQVPAQPGPPAHEKTVAQPRATPAPDLVPACSHGGGTTRGRERRRGGAGRGHGPPGGRALDARRARAARPPGGQGVHRRAAAAGV